MEEFLVDEEFLRKLEKNEINKPEILAKVLPARPWHEDKLSRFLSNLSAQAKSTETV